MVAAQLIAVEPPSPTISRVYPLGGQRGTSVEVEILGAHLSNATSVRFDCRDLTWTKTTHASSGRLAGLVSVASDAPLGPHLVNVATSDGDSNYAMSNVGQFADLRETEPNNRLRKAQPITGSPVEVQGVLEGAVDIDLYSFQARADERWSIELRSIEYGSAVQAKMFLLDSEGRRVAFNADRDDYLETPFIEHTFEDSGTYHIKVDQYRGPRGFNFGKNSAYILRLSALPTIRFVSPLGGHVGGRVGARTRITLAGTGLNSVEQVYLTQARLGEHARMTYPFTMRFTSGRTPRRVVTSRASTAVSCTATTPRSWRMS